MKILIESIGYIGMLLTFGAYFGLERGKLKASGLLYPSLNAVSGVCLLIVGIFYNTFSIILLNIFWVIISVSLLRKNLRKV